MRSDPHVDGLVDAVRRGLVAAAEPARAPAMQAYMKASMPYLGVTMPALRVAVRPIFAAHPVADAVAWRTAVLRLWREATHREQRYAAMELAGHRVYRPWRTLDALAMYDEMILTGAWWDYVDGIATSLVGELLREHPGEMTATLRRWAHDPDPWRRRTAILAQISFRSATDRELLTEAIDASIDERGFSCARGSDGPCGSCRRATRSGLWGFVQARRDRLSGLSLREATRRLPVELRDQALG